MREEGNEYKKSLLQQVLLSVFSNGQPRGSLKMCLNQSEWRKGRERNLSRGGVEQGMKGEKDERERKKAETVQWERNQAGRS